MGRQRVPNRVSHNSQDSCSVSEGFHPDEIDADFLEKQVEDRPIFIARMPNLEEPHSLRTVFISQSIWNRILEFTYGITDRQQILLLRSIIVLLACMLFWSMANKPSSNSSDLVQMVDSLTEGTLAETLLYSNNEPYRDEKSVSPQSGITNERLAFNSLSQAGRERNNDDLLPVIATTSIDLTQSAELSEEPSSVFHSNMRPTPPTSSAWDRDVYSIPSTVSMETRNFAAVPSNDPTPDYSAFATPSYGTPSTNRYNEPEVRQVHYYQNPTTVPNYSEQAATFFSQGNHQYPANANPGTGAAYQASQIPQSPQMSVSYGQQYPSTVQYQNHPSYNNMVNDREERIPATFTNNTYRTPGTSQMNNTGNTIGQVNPLATSPQGYYGQSGTNNTSNVPQQFNQQNYGTAASPVNSLYR